MTLNQMLSVLYPPTRPEQLTADQMRVLTHSSGPGMTLAGPGSGKTEVLTLLVLRLLFVDQIHAESVFVTTFTEKAARNLEDRLAHYRAALVKAIPELASVDISALRIGTLHGLCNDILQEHRAPNYQNVRLMDELETALFVYENCDALNEPASKTRPFWSAFQWCFSPQEWPADPAHVPNKWARVGAYVTLFNHIVEDRISVSSMHKAGSPWDELATHFEAFSKSLVEQHRCDFANVQARFLTFLRSPPGLSFVKGDGARHKGIKWVLVDEYQDTNLIQEAIYFALAAAGAHNLVIVGDDDQAMYRFRGGAVECMVTFPDACEAFYGLKAASIPRYALVDNFRSHKDIITFCNSYISSFPSTQLPGARVSGKPPLTPKSSITGTYPAVSLVSGATAAAVAQRFAELVQGLMDNKVITDYSQCCLLLRSTKESPHNALPYVRALADRNIPVYNPRNKAFLDQEEVQGLLGAIISVLDPGGARVPQWAGFRTAELRKMVAKFLATYGLLALANNHLKNYVSDAAAALAKKPDSYASSGLQELSYLVMSHEPFNTWANDPVRRVRLARITGLLESYASLPVPGRPNVSRGHFRTDPAGKGAVDFWIHDFYNQFVAYLSRTGMNDEEDEDVVSPAGMLPIMTMHQSKGLEFPFVFVGHLNQGAEVGMPHLIETTLSKFPEDPRRVFSRLPEATRAELDVIRQYFVAYSRAQTALILLGTTNQLNAGKPPCGPNKSWIRNNARVLIQ